MGDKIEPFDFSESLTLEESCEKFSRILGLDQPVPKAVMIGAMKHPTYAHNLLVCRNSPPFLQQLLHNPPAVEEAVEAPVVAGKQQATNFDLLKKASVSLWKWSKVGFTNVDEETYQRRYSACLACEYNTDAPNRLVYKLAKRKNQANTVCALCGCMVAKKARVPSENCPAKHPSLPGLSRWGEPM